MLGRVTRRTLSCCRQVSVFFLEPSDEAVEKEWASRLQNPRNSEESQGAE